MKTIILNILTFFTLVDLAYIDGGDDIIIIAISYPFIMAVLYIAIKNFD